MTRYMDVLEPTPGFREYLEQEIVDAWHIESVRRPPATWMRRLRTAAVIAVAVAAGAGGTVATAQVRDARQRDELRSVAESQYELAKLRYELVRLAQEDVRRTMNLGVSTREALAQATMELHAMQANLQKLRMNLDETVATAAPVRDELWAPLVKGRDFVADRLKIDLAVAEKRLTAAEDEVAQAERARAVGMINAQPLLEAQARLTAMQSAMELTAGKLDLRNRFLQSRLAPATVERQREELELKQSLRTAELDLQVAETRASRARELRAAGQVSQTDLLRAELELAESKQGLDTVRARLDALKRIRQ